MTTIAPTIARLKILLKDVTPQPMRQIEVPMDIRLDRLHQVVQAAMGWSNTHLYEFRAGGREWGVRDPYGLYDSPRPAKKTTLKEVYLKTEVKTIRYLYDFGDCWDHIIRLEKISGAIPGTNYPRLLKASRACPPEDVGGGAGYEEFLEAIANPEHEHHEATVDWMGGSFDPEDAQIDTINARLERLAKRWASRPGKPKATT